MAKYTNSDLLHACARSHPGIYPPLIHSLVSNDSVSGQRRTWSDCADVQADLGLRRSHMLEDTFSHGAAYLIFGPLELLGSYVMHENRVPFKPPRGVRLFVRDSS